MNINETELIGRVSMFAWLDSDDKIFDNLCICYGQLSDACLGSAGHEIIENNRYTYEYILSDCIIDYMTYKNLKGELKDHTDLYTHLNEMLTVSSQNYVGKILSNRIGITPKKEISIEDIKKATGLFGLGKTDSYDGDIDAIDLRDLEDENIESEKSDELQVDNNGLDDMGLEDIELRGNESENQHDTQIIGESSKEYEDLRSVWGNDLSTVVDSLMKSYNALYNSGYGLINPSGVLTNQGIIRSKADGNLTITGDRVIDIKLYNAIKDTTGDTFKYFASGNVEPNIQDIGKLAYPVTYANMHIKNMFGHLNYCKGEHGIREYLTRNNIQNESSTKVVKYSDISGWIRENTERYFYNAYRQCGINGNIDSDSIKKVESINVTLCRSLKNVIIVVERKKNVNTRIRICSDNQLDVRSIMNSISKALNIGNASNIEVKQIGNYENGVLDINIIYNSKIYSQDTLFAYQVLDILKDQGIRPSWDNVILGKKDDGTIMTYDFKDKKNSTYALYASSRSGKGVMTLNLLASALADSCKLIYIDGKPDMGEVLTDIAWKDGVDTCVFNGVQGKGNISLENRGNCIRNHKQYDDLDSIPDNIFDTESEKRKFIQTVTYLRGMELISLLAADRASSGVNNNDWVVAVVDECEQAAILEETVNLMLDNAEKERKGALDENGKKINIAQDKAYQFIQEYKKWIKIVVSNFKTCVTSTFGFANMTVFFVWQSTTFPQKYINTSYIAQIINACNSSITKLVGRGAAVPNGSRFFGTPTSLKDVNWYDSRFSGQNGGYFAIGKDVNTDNMTVFRPFNVYSDAKNKQLILENAKASGLSEQDLYGVSLNPDGSIIKGIGFEGYASELLKEYNMTVSQQLSIGYQYCDNTIRNKGIASSLIDFMYNYCSFESYDPSVEEDKIDNTSFGMNIDGFESEQNINDTNANGEFDSKFDFTEDDVEDTVKTPKTEPYDKGKFGDNLSNLGRTDNISEQDSGIYKRSNDISHMENASPEPEVVNSKRESAYKLGDAKDGYYTFITPSRTAKILNLDKDNSCLVTVRDHRDMNKAHSLMKTFKGADYELSSRWKSILYAIAKQQSPSTITNVTLFNDALIFNKRQIAAIGLIGGNDGVEVKDIVSFIQLANMFRNIRKLSIDTEIYDSALLELGDVPELQMFSLLSNLVTLSVWKTGYDVPPIVYNRQTLENDLIKNGQKEQSDRARLKRGIDTFSAAHNPRFKDKDSINKYRIVRGSKNFTSSSWNKCKQAYQSDNFVGSGLIGTFTVASAIFTGSIMGIAKLTTMFKR